MNSFSWRRALGAVAAIAAAILALWLVLAMISAVPVPELHMFEQSGLRLLAELTVMSLLVAAFGFWDE